MPQFSIFHVAGKKGRSLRGHVIHVRSPGQYIFFLFLSTGDFSSLVPFMDSYISFCCSTPILLVISAQVQRWKRARWCVAINSSLQRWSKVHQSEGSESPFQKAEKSEKGFCKKAEVNQAEKRPLKSYSKGVYTFQKSLFSKGTTRSFSIFFLEITCLLHWISDSYSM